MVCFVNVKSVDRILLHFPALNLEWKTRTLKLLHKLRDITHPKTGVNPKTETVKK
jgi:hypothetical protein